MSDQPDTISVGQAPQQNAGRLRRKEWHKVGATKAGVRGAAHRGRGRAACVKKGGQDLPHRPRWQDRDEGQVDIPMRLETCTRLVQEAACVDAVAACVDVAGFLFNVVKEDIIFKEISAIVQRLNMSSKV